MTKVSEEYIFTQLKEELARLDRSKKQRKAMARRSFIIWSQKTLVDIGKSLGYIIVAPQRLCKDIYKWMFD